MNLAGRVSRGQHVPVPSALTGGNTGCETPPTLPSPREDGQGCSRTLSFLKSAPRDYGNCPRVLHNLSPRGLLRPRLALGDTAVPSGPLGWGGHPWPLARVTAGSFGQEGPRGRSRGPCLHFSTLFLPGGAAERSPDARVPAEAALPPASVPGDACASLLAKCCLF